MDILQFVRFCHLVSFALPADILSMSGLLAVHAFVLFVLGHRFRLPLAFCFSEQRRVRVVALSLFLRKNGVCDFVQGML